MKIDLNALKYYFLTCNTNGPRKKHMMDEFKDYSLTEVNPIMGISNFSSGSSGFIRMIELGLRNQNRALPFQPFVLFEDDCSMYRKFPDIIEIPDDSDVLHIGLSRCGTHKTTIWQNKVYMKNIDADVVRVFNMLSLHGVMITSALGAATFTKAMMESYFKNKPWDLPTAALQPFYNVYALKIPLVYQDMQYDGRQVETHIEFNSDNRLIRFEEFPIEEQMTDYDSVKLLNQRV